MKVDFSYTFIDETSSTHLLQINEVNDCNKLFSVSAKKKEENAISSYLIQIELLQKTKVNASLNARIIFNGDEKLVFVKSILPNLDFKYFVPDQLEVFTSNRRFIISFKKPYSLSYIYDDKSIDFTIIIDAPFMHPSWDYSKGQRISIADPIVEKGVNYNIDFDITQLESSAKVVEIKKSPYPFSYKAAFILTDHCDFDTTEKLKLFLYGNNNNGWLKRNLKITKGVFALGPKEGELKKSASLEDEEYAALINLLHEDGSEIVHHALKHSGQLTADEFTKTFNQFAKKFKPQTWIDHGSYIKYCYSQGGKDNPDFKLIENMRNHDYNNLWSFDDVNIDANQTLNILTNKKVFPKQLIQQLFLNLSKGKVLIAGHYFRSIIHRNYTKNIFNDFLMYSMASTKSIFINLKKGKKSFISDSSRFVKSIFNFNDFRNNEIVPYSEKEVLQFALPLYLENRIPFVQYKPTDMVMFYTFETTHLIDIYNEKSIHKLINENGTHIGHTYILNDLPYINSIFITKRKKLQLDNKWIEFLNILEQKIKSKEVWNPNMGEYVSYNISLLNVFVQYQANGSCIIKNTNEHNVEGFTFINETYTSLQVNENVLHAEYQHNGYNYFTLTLLAMKDYRITL